MHRIGNASWPGCRNYSACFDQVMYESGADKPVVRPSAGLPATPKMVSLMLGKQPPHRPDGRGPAVVRLGSRSKLSSHPCSPTTTYGLRKVALSQGNPCICLYRPADLLLLPETMSRLSAVTGGDPALSAPRLLHHAERIPACVCLLILFP